MIKQLAILTVILLLVQSCATVPVTGRKQLSLVSNSEIISESATQYKTVLSQSKLSTDAHQVELVKTVGNRIRTAVESYMQSKGLSGELAGFDWEFNVIQDDKTVNAWCMPGGKVAFYTAILPICKDEDGIAVVMGHEVAHAIANHGRERMSQSMIENGLLSSLGAAMGQNPSQTSQLLLQAVGAGANIGLLKFSRDDESEADHIGLIFLAMAGYNPNVAPKFWERMVALSAGQQQPEFLSTHPSHETRIKDLQGWIPEAMSYKK
jgi:predicted Zn-dependent protease